MNEDWKAESDPLAALGSGDPKPFEAFVIRETPTFLAFFRRLGAHPQGRNHGGGAGHQFLAA